MPRLELVYLSYSPWSERARWALDHHGLNYRRTHFQPLIGEPGMRWRTRNFKNKVTAPALFDGETWYLDSWDIARRADALGAKKATLFPDNKLKEIERFNQLGERGLAAARAVGLRKVLTSDEALLALVPGYLKSSLGRAASKAIAAAGVRRALRKYGATQDDEEFRAELREVLETLRASLKASPKGPKTLLGRFSYADIATVQVVQMVKPKDLGGFKLAEASRDSYTDEEFAEEFADLLAWRDALYAAHRPEPGGTR